MLNNNSIPGDVQNEKLNTGRNHRKHEKNGHGGERVPVKTAGLNCVKLHRVRKKEE